MLSDINGGLSSGNQIEDIWQKSLYRLSSKNLSFGYVLEVQKEWLHLFKDKEIEKKLEASLKKFEAKGLKDFREHLVIEGTSLMVSYFFHDKKILVSSPRLHNELYIINEVSAMLLSTRSENKEIKNLSKYDDYLKLKDFVSKIACMKSLEFPSVFEIVSIQNNFLDLDDKKYIETKDHSKKIVKELLVKIKEYRPSLFERFTDFGLQLTAMYALLRIHQLKFIAILPSLDGDKTGVEVKRVLLESLRRVVDDSKRAEGLKIKGEMRSLPKVYIYLFQFLIVAFSLIPARPLSKIIRLTIRFMAKRFIAGESIDKANHSLAEIFKTKRDVTLDQLGELVVSEKEADGYLREVLSLIKGYSLHINKGAQNKANINKAHVSIKVSALCHDFLPEAFNHTYKMVAPRLKKILIEAKEHCVFLNIDAEHYHYRDVVFKIYKKLLLETPELKGFLATGIVVQAYLRDSSSHLDEVIQLSKERGVIMPIRLVKGAYWDAETVESDAHGHIAPEFLNKEETDLNFRQLIIQIFDNHPHVQLCIASHNFSDHAFCESLRELFYPKLPQIEHQCLHMTYEALSVGMVKMGWVVRNYVPIGSLIVGMAYLVRRIMENSSQVGVLTIMRSHNKAASLITPTEIHKDKIIKNQLERDLLTNSLSDEFLNLSPLRIYLDEERSSIEKELKNISFKKGYLVEKMPNHFEASGEIHKVYSSSDSQYFVGEIKFSTIEDVSSAIKILDNSFNNGTWRKSPPQIRALSLIKAANIMIGKRNELAVLISYEAGKSVEEALGDVDEAVDFLTFYARCETELSKKYRYIDARGVVAVIAPWNFPLAIPCGMVASALVSGNSVVLKSAEQTPLIADALINIFHQAGVGVETLIHLPGLGETVGDALVKHQRVAGVIFTGSKAVGQLIAKNAAHRIYHNQIKNSYYPVKVITELGGKNGVIVTANAELDETVSEILYSSFGHSGQKCSACSRVIVHNSVKDKLIERVKEATLDMQVGKAFLLNTKMNPIISKEDVIRLKNQIKEAAQEARDYGGRIIVDRSEEELPGNCIGPAIFELPLDRALNQESFARKELFGPVVHIMGFNTVDEAIKLYNITEYALTGGIFCQSEDDIQIIKEQLHSGNIYINRSITGARVGIEPFGGFKLSGTGPKAGSFSYVKAMHLFVDEYLKIENKAINSFDEEGSEYQFDFKSESKLGISARTMRFIRSMGQFMTQFENMYNGIESDGKNVFINFQSYIDNNLEILLTKHENNRLIKGQLSYNDYSLIKKKTLLVSHEERPQFNTLLSVLSAICVGSGLLILCRTKKSFDWWNQFISFFHRSGFSKDNLDVYFSSKKLLNKALLNKELETVIFDSSSKNDERMIAYYQIIQERIISDHIVNMITPFDMPELSDFESYIRLFTKTRSFAINIMRHGAKMNIDGE